MTANLFEVLSYEFLIRVDFNESVSTATSYQCAEMVSVFSFPWKETSARTPTWESCFLALWLMRADITHSPLAQLVCTLELQMGRTACCAYFDRRTMWPSAQHSCGPKDSQKWAKPTGSEQPVLSSLPQELSSESHLLESLSNLPKNWVLRATYWNLSLICWP